MISGEYSFSSQNGKQNADTFDQLNNQRSHFDNFDSISGSDSYYFDRKVDAHNGLNRNGDQNTDNYNLNNFGSNDDWFNSQHGRSVESFDANDNNYGVEHSIQNQDISYGSATLGRSIVQKIVALDRIVTERHRYNRHNLLDVANPLYVKNHVIKMTKRDFVNFKDTEMNGLDEGHLQYLAINVPKDSVYVESSFDKLSVGGTFKTNLQEVKGGRFSVDMQNVRSNITSTFHRGRAIIKPARSATNSVNVLADHHESAAIKESINDKYLMVLGQAVSGEVYNSTHKGMVAQLKTEIKTPIVADRSPITLEDMHFAADNTVIKMTNIGHLPWSLLSRKLDSMSYARNDRNSYKMCFDIGLEGLKWTSDLTATSNGQITVQAQALAFAVNSVKIHVSIFKSVDSQQCLNIKSVVKVNGFQYNSNEHLPSDVLKKLPKFVQQHFETYMKNTLERDVCNNQLNNANNYNY